MIGQKKVPSREGGVEIVVEKLAAGLAERGHSVTLYNRRKHGQPDTSDLLLRDRVVCKTVFTIDRMGFAAVSASLIGSVRAAFGSYDIVHYHAEGPALFCLIPKLMGKTIVVTVHGLDWKREKWGRFARQMIKLGEKAAVRWADRIIVLSENMQRYFMQEYGLKTEFIPNGVELPEIPETGARESYLLFLGRLVPEKGVHTLIEAFQKVKDDPALKGKKLIIAGGCSDTENYCRYLRRLAEGDGRIEFTGFVQGRRLAELFSNAYLYILPSSVEGMPLSLLEAMSYGNCCLVSDIPELTEVVGDCGIVCRVGDSNDLAEKLRTDPQIIAGYRSVARGDILRRYDWNTTIEKNLKIYESAVGVHKRHFTEAKNDKNG